jgi:tRNA-splicing ligase RtcB (3'-phosphate/5'-hydroxy nucleic acid ligase)
MSRTRAFKELSLDEAKEQMDGVFSTTLNKHTLDEVPKVYKDAKEIIEAIEPTVKVIKNIKSVYNFKGI